MAVSEHYAPKVDSVSLPDTTGFAHHNYVRGEVITTAHLTEDHQKELADKDSRLSSLLKAVEKTKALRYLAARAAGKGHSAAAEAADDVDAPTGEPEAVKAPADPVKAPPVVAPVAAPPAAAPPVATPPVAAPPAGS